MGINSACRLLSAAAACCLPLMPASNVAQVLGECQTSEQRGCRAPKEPHVPQLW